jgi:uncharacterized protein involved in exopolysaccharide biosynthesis
MRSERDDSVDLFEVAVVLRRGVRWIAGGLILGGILAAAITFALPRRFEATTTVLLRNQSDAPSSALSLLGGAGGALGDLLPGATRTGLDTELEILRSRTIIGAVADSLGLQARVVRPAGTESNRVIASARLLPTIDKARYRFTRADAGFEVRGPRFRGVAHAGQPLEIPEGQITLHRGDLPASFVVELRGREDVITRVENRLKTTKPGGEIVRMEYRAGDAWTAAAVPNALVGSYLGRRTTSDRGVNRRRFEFLMQKSDSIAAELSEAEMHLRRHQEATGVLDPRQVGAAELEQGMRVRGEVETLDVEIRALEQVLARIEAGGGARELAAYPTFLRSPAINDLLSRLFELETTMLELLERRTEQDPQVVVVATSIDYLESQLSAMSREYLAGLRQQRAELDRGLGSYRSVLARLPADAEQSYRLEREVRRLAETQLVLQAQLIDARLATITEGGDVRQIDVAVPPRKPSSPSLPLNLGIGLVGGLLLGTVGALGSGYFGQRVRSPWEAELAAGIPAVSLKGRVPLLLGGAREQKSLVLVPLGRGVSSGAIARRIAASAVEQGRSVAVADFADPRPADVLPPAAQLAAITAGNGNDAVAQIDSIGGATNGAGYPIFHGRSNGSAVALLNDLERRYSLVIAALPDIGEPGAASVLSPDRPVAFVARCGDVTRAELQESVSSLQRAGIPTLSVILDEAE